MPGPVDEAGIFVAVFGIERQRRFLHQHLRKADDGVERRAQFVAHSGQEAAFGGVGALRLGVRVQKRLLVAFALGDIAQHRNDLATVLPAGIAARLLERPAAHLDPDELRRRAGRRRRRLPAAFGTRLNSFPQSRGIAQCLQIGRAVGDMDPLEKAVSVQLRDARTE